MKTILLILSLTLSASAATLYPVLTDNAVRTFSGGGTNLALLNTNQTYTGTPTFPAAVFSANGVRYRTLFVTNVFVESVIYATNAATAGSPTNAGENVHATTFIDINLPRLLSTNSSLYFNLGFIRTNAQVDRTGIAVYCGTNTNCVFWSQSFVGNGTTVPQLFNDAVSARLLFSNFGSFTNQLPPNQTSPTYVTNLSGFHLADTSTNFNLKVAGAAFSSAGPNTNFMFLFKAIEIVD